MAERVSVDEAARRLSALHGSELIGIDGLPCSGKSTLVDRIAAVADVHCLYLDDFVRPEREWPSHDRPAFPFEYIRYDAFLGAIRDLARRGACTIHRFDWSTGSVADEPHHIVRDRPVIVEGVSALNADVAELYDLKVFVESDRKTVMEAVAARGAGPWPAVWEKLFLPSADLYMATRPEARADLLVAGRGAQRPALSLHRNA